MAFSQQSDVSLRRIAADAQESERKRTARFLFEILENRANFRFALSAAIQVLLIAFTVLISLIVYRIFPTPREILLYSFGIALLLSFIFRQIVPRILIGKNPESKLLLFLPLFRPLYRVWSFLASPFSIVYHKKEGQNLETSVVPETIEERTDDDADDIHALMEVGKAEGIIEEEDRELIETMFEFSDTRVEEIMTPRTEICALPINATVKNARDLINEEKYSRLPVYRDNVDNIEGVIYVRDLLQAWAEGKEDQAIESLLRPAYFVPETKSAAELLKNMQTSHVQVAIVVDEYGGVAGLVTVEDILEEIVGEIEDEDIAEEEIVEIIEGAEGYYDVLGSTEIGKIERLFDMEIEDDDFTTIAGLVTSEVGYVPKPDEKLYFRGLEVEILEADEKRIYRLRLRQFVEEEIIRDVEEISGK
ncbi:MAG TPA: hemolysin family protein, partial [Pyrinomonadaceae bacterium]|nr:hemolysin family protein [Pyrinomonadaceae bacterium]